MKKQNNLFTSVIIAAAGHGTRMNIGMSKQYVNISGKPMLARTIQAFEDCNDINEIILVVNGQDIVYCKQNVIDEYDFMKVRTLVAGGGTRQDSVHNGLLEVNKECDIVLIHDGARPFIKADIIINSINTAFEHNAACVAVPVKDTIKSADSEGFIRETMDRSALWSVQTPQAFKYDLIMKAYQRAQEDGYTGTDDAVLAERLGIHVKFVMGSYDNIKVTTKEDLTVAEAIIGALEE